MYKIQFISLISNNLLLQWGYYDSDSAGLVTINYPISFSEFVSVISQRDAYITDSSYATARSQYIKIEGVLKFYFDNGSASNLMWIAIGY